MEPEPDEELLPLFPLSNVVLFPRVQTPLHLFEPRYRELARDALAGSRRIGMVVVPPEHVPEMAGDPPVYPIGCAGAIEKSRRLPDGRYDIVLAGTHRFRVLSELPRPAERLYRVARVERLADALDPADQDRLTALRREVLASLRSLADLTRSGGADGLSPKRLSGVDDETLVNALSNAFDFEPPEKQSLLEAEGVAARYARLADLFAFRLAELRSPGAPRSGALH